MPLTKAAAGEKIGEESGEKMGGIVVVEEINKVRAISSHLFTRRSEDDAFSGNGAEFLPLSSHEPKRKTKKRYYKDSTINTVLQR